MKINWNQSGMATSFINQAGARPTLSEFRSVLQDAQNQIMSPVDAESMARELVESDGREYVEMVRELSTSLANTKKELDDANRRYERLVADLEKRGIRIGEDEPQRNDTDAPPAKPEPATDGVDEWEAWNRKFQSLLG